MDAQRPCAIKAAGPSCRPKSAASERCSPGTCWAGHSPKPLRDDEGMSTQETETLRTQLATAMSGRESHIDFDSAMKDFPAEARGAKPAGAPHSAWELVEHMRIAQHDILEFSRNSQHKSPKWPDEYWPKTAAPPDAKAWDAAVKSFGQDAREFSKLVEDVQQDLFKPFAYGDGQTLLREALLVATHNSYHLGQLIFLKKMLAQ